MKYTHLIWDFNGTILDDVEIGIESVNVLLKERNLPPIASVRDYRRVFGFPILSYYQRLGFDFSKEPYETVAPLWVKEYLARVKNAKVNPGVRETIGHVRFLGIEQIILSATELGMLKGQLADIGLEDGFSEILGLDNIHAGSKESLATAWREQHPNAVPLFFGDTDHDFHVAKSVGADCVLFSGGHQSRDTLGKFGCPVIGRVEDVISFL